MTDADQTAVALEHVPTDIAGLDTVLNGGLIPGSVYMIQGAPGTGKTTLANQICFNRAARGERSLYVTLLAESHHRLIRNLSTMHFMDPRHVAEAVYYESAFDSLMQDGLQGVKRLLGRDSKARQASFIVLDGLFVIEETVRSEAEFRRFINDLTALAEFRDATILLLTNDRRQPGSPEYTMVDGWMELGMENIGARSSRYLQVHKYRGSDFVSGRHYATISRDGYQVFPRFEAIHGASLTTSARAERLAIGVPGIDNLLSGGLPVTSTTLVAGPTGTGKTTLGLHFLSQCTPEAPGLMVGFYESAERLQRRALELGLDWQRKLDSGAIRMLWYPTTENALDPIGQDILKTVRRGRIKRLFLDGVNAFERTTLYPERTTRFLSTLANALRNHGVTAIFSTEIPELVSGETQTPISAISAVAENLLLLRFLELDARLCRTLSVIKMRESNFDPAVHEVHITETGMQLGAPFSPRMKDLLTGHAHRMAPEHPSND